jgi:hypothetical protein
MSPEQLKEFRNNGMLLDPKYDLLTNAYKQHMDITEETKIISIEVIKQKQDREGFYNFITKVSITNDNPQNKVVIQIDSKEFQTYKKLDIFELNVFYADVYIDFSTVVREEENFKLTASLIHINSNKTVDTKSINVKVDRSGNVAETNSAIENIEDVCVNCCVDKTLFFNKYEIEFGKISKEKVYNIDLILDALCRYYKEENRICDKFTLSYILATTKHETADTYEPINEYGGVTYYEEMYDPVLGKNDKRKNLAKENGNTIQGDGVKYHGRGFVQLTWKDNYEKMKEKFKIDLINYPEKALDLELAIKIMVYGFEKGIFTGKKLSDYITELKQDYYNARRVINGVDKAETIKNYAIKIEKCIEFNNK